MQIAVSGQQINIGNALQEYVQETLNKKVKKYFERAVDAKVVFSKQSHLVRADVQVNEGTGQHMAIKGQADETEIYRAFDMAVERITKQLRRYHRRIKDHHRNSNPDHESLLEEPNGKKNKKARQMILSASSEEEEPTNEHDIPLIIAEKQTDIETLTVGNAVMRMDLSQAPALMFTNKQTGRINVVYRREDGNVAWIDPE